MKFRKLTNWSIATRLMWITLLPVLLLFFSVVPFTYMVRLGEVRSEVVERGKVVARAIAESSEYSLGAGNFAELERMSKGFLKSDSSIRVIRVLDSQQREVFRIAADGPPDRTIPVAKSEILRQAPIVEDFGATGEPHLTAPAADQSSLFKPTVIGLAEVSMSAMDVLAIQKVRLYQQTAIALVALMASILASRPLSNTLKRPLATIIAAVNGIRAGKYDADIVVTNGGEIGDLQASIKEMSISLSEAKQNLERKVQERTIALEQSRNEALKANYEKRKLIQKVNTAVEDERKSISIEIHDQLNATLIAAKLNSERIIHLAQQQPSSTASIEIAAHAQTIMNLTLELYKNARIIVRRLRPEVLDMLGLRGAIEEMIHTYNASHPSCHFEFKENGDCSKLDGGLSITIFRLIQEGLSNIVKHANASQAFVTLKIDEAEKVVRLTVLDNGVGCNLSHEGEGIGLIGMKERVYPYNGKFQFDSTPGQGSKITIRLPLMHEQLEDPGT